MFAILKYLISEDIKCKSIPRTVAFVVDSEEWYKYDNLPYASTMEKRSKNIIFLWIHSPVSQKWVGVDLNLVSVFQTI